VLEERLAQLTRRSQLRPDSSDDDSDDADNDRAAHEAGSSLTNQAPADRSQGERAALVTNPDSQTKSLPANVAADWECLAQGHLSARCSLDCEGQGWGLGEHMVRLRGEVDEQGYFLGVYMCVSA